MGKGPTRARFNASISLTTLGGMGEVYATIKVMEGRKVISEYELPMTAFHGVTDMPNVVGRHEAEQVFTKIASEIEKRVRWHGGF